MNWFFGFLLLGLAVWNLWIGFDSISFELGAWALNILVGCLCTVGAGTQFVLAMNNY